APRAEEYRARAEGAHGGRVVRDEQHSRAALLNLLYAPEATVLEDGVADGERLVNDEYVGLHVRRDREGEAHEHARRVCLDGLLHELPYLREALDVGEEAFGLATREP